MTLSDYTPELADNICHRMAEGESLRSICRDAGIPTEGTIRGWAVRIVDGFGKRYRAARLLPLEFWSDQIVDIADDRDLDPRERQVMVHTRQWLMSKLAPRRYGERLLHSGDPDNSVQIMHAQVSLDDLTVVQLEALQQFATALIEAKPEPAAI